MGIALALESVAWQMRQGAGNSTEAKPSSASRKIKEALLTDVATPPYRICEK